MKKKLSLRQQQKQFEDWANDQLKKLQVRLFLQDRFLEPIRYVDDLPHTADYECNHPYKTIQIQYGPKLANAWTKGRKRLIYETLVHEMMHAVSDGFYTKARARWVSESELADELEAMTELLTKIIVSHD